MTANYPITYPKLRFGRHRLKKVRRERHHSCFAGTRWPADLTAGYGLRFLFDILAIDDCSTMGLERQMRYFGLALALLLAACTSSMKLGPQTVAGLTPDGTVDMNEVQAAFIGSAGGRVGA